MTDQRRQFLTPPVRLSRWISAFLTQHSFRGAGLLRDRISRVLTPRPSGPVVVQTTLGFDLLIDPSLDRGVEWDIYYQGIYEAGTLHVLRHVLRAGDTFVDVGANIGLMTLAGAATVGREGRVYAFEPLPSVYEILLRNIALNHAANVRAYAVALGETEETRAIYENPDVNRASASLLDTGRSRAAAEVRVEVLDHVLRELGVGAAHALKVDVEGWELPVLLGAKELLSSDAAPVLIAECSETVPGDAGRLKDLHDFVTVVNDYQVFKLKRGKGSISRLQRVRGVDDLPRHDNLFCFRPAHLRDDLRGLFAASQ